jgi:hypothetical protein
MWVSNIYKHNINLLIKAIKMVFGLFGMRLGAEVLDATQQTRVI